MRLPPAGDAASLGEPGEWSRHKGELYTALEMMAAAWTAMRNHVQLVDCNEAARPPAEAHALWTSLRVSGNVP